MLYILPILCIPNLSFSQIDKNVELRKFSFGKAWFYNDTSHVVGLGNPYDKEGVVNANYFYSIADTILDGNFAEKVLKASEIKSIWLSKIEIDHFLPRSFLSEPMSSINKPIWMIQSKVSEIFYLKNIRFLGNVYLSGNDFYSRGWMNQIDSCVFESNFTCNADSFLLSVFNISNSQFRDDVELVNNFYKYGLEINNSTFNSTLYLNASNFQTRFLIQDSKIRNLSITRASFDHEPSFRRIELVDTVDLSNTNFEKGVDFRSIDFRNVSTIFLDNTSYPLGKLIIYWDKIKGEDKPKISLKNKSGNDEDDFIRLEEVYIQIKNNFLAQGDKISADAVSYELAWHKDLTVGGFWQWLYGVSLGYGYEPLRYLFFPIVITIIIFWFIWYHKYYNIIVYIFNKGIDADLELNPHYSIKFPTKKIFCFNMIDHKKIDPKINFITKFWHSIHFSASVLVGIRFKKDWIRFSKKHKHGINSFLWIVTLEYMLGKSFLILLLIFIKVQPFENWKVFLGL